MLCAGPLGKDSASLIAYFEGVHGVHPIPDGLNPSVWMLEVTMPGNEDRLGVDFADIYANSDLSKYAPECASLPTTCGGHACEAHGHVERCMEHWQQCILLVQSTGAAQAALLDHRACMH